MKSNRWIESSQRAYARLLKLYPQAHREAYGESMLQVFGDQCREAQACRGGPGLLALWLRTLLDLAVSILREHVTDPNATGGLLDAIPGKPLPWKGVALVLIPGLVFFVCQVAQAFGDDWFFYMARRAAYILIIPALLVWAWKRKFPVWGLTPLGLLYKTLFDLAYHVQVGMTPSWLWEIVTPFVVQYWIWLQAGVVLILLTSLTLVARNLMQREQFPRQAWPWLAVFAVVTFLRPLLFVENVLRANGLEWNAAFSPIDRGWVVDLFYWEFFFAAGFLLMIFLSVLLARRHGSLALLFPLGYLIPTIVYGHYGEYSGPQVLLTVLIPAVLLYRTLIALVAPVWVARAEALPAQKRIFAVTVGTAIAVQFAVNILTVVLTDSMGDATFESYFWVTADQWIAIIGFGLALALFRALPALSQAGPSGPAVQEKVTAGD